ncbi:hypothetical protein B0H16DRAFT_1563091 [Mycena metata]|uniref:AB hydrolase-1 domain-containing protein n=1 Tax=Mycena metata TaxID=1033252 RepID=A0AAD7N294_9AGAR|nr:hypothetical protein B0H16DRAFT_1563091 [Mycena metata]
MPQTLVHLVYIHGFQGNDTSFQTFPTDLQEHLAANIPPHLNIKIQSSLYPTYKSRKPIALATQNFLAWLSTQPPGPVILLAHSMGGLLAADAATDASNFGISRARRILGVVAFDVPYLGMHPHVVVSGIASLFPGDDGDKTTAGDMNQHSDVQIVDDQVTDDWDAYKKNLDSNRSMHSRSRSHSPIPPPSPLAGTSAPMSPIPQANPFGLPSSPLIDKTLSFLTTHADDPLVRWVRKHSDEPFSASKRFVVEYFQFGVCMFDPSGLKERYARLVAWPDGLWVNYWTQTPPREPKDNAEKKLDSAAEEADNDVALLQTGMTSMSTVESYATAETSRSPLSPTLSSLSPSTASAASTLASPLSPTSPASPASPSATSPTSPSDAKALAKAAKAEEKERRALEKTRAKELKKIQKQRAKEEKAQKGRPGHHFIVLPTGLGQILGGGDKWESVIIGGVEDEVAAHTGLFIRGQNLDYEALVQRVGRRVLGWCEVL